MTAFTLIGLAAAACTTFAFLPQALLVIRTKQTQGLSLSMYSLFTLGVFLWLLYGLITMDYPVIIANTVTFLFAATILGMKLKYK